MTNSNAFSANDTATPESHRHFEFGTFYERLIHACMLLEVDQPEITYEDGEPTLTDTFVDWIKEHGVNMDWLFIGSPSGLLYADTKERQKSKRFSNVVTKLEPELQTGMLTLLKAVTIHKLPMEESLVVFDQVVKEFRGQATANEISSL